MGVPVMKGQQSIEFLLTISMFIAFTLPLVTLTFIQSKSQLEAKQEEYLFTGTKVLENAIEEVYYEGKGTKREVTIFFPKGFRKLEIKDRFMIVEYNTDQGKERVVKKISPKTTELTITNTTQATISIINTGKKILLQQVVIR